MAASSAGIARCSSIAGAMRRSRRALVRTNTEDNAIAPAVKASDRNPLWIAPRQRPE